MALDLGIFLEGSQSTFKVKVSENDAQAQFLLDKLTSSDGSVTITETNDGGIETIDLVAGGGSPLTTKGDLFTYSTADARLGVGTDGQTLLADSAEATGLKWGTISADNMATADLTLTLARTHDLAGFELKFDNGQVTIEGAGSTSATTTLLVENSSGTDLLKIDDDGGFALGNGATYLDNTSVSIGSNAIATGINGAVSIGAGSSSAGGSSVSIGYSASTTNGRAIAIGQNAAVSNTGGVSIGGNSDTVNGVAVGDGSQALNTESVAIGNSANANAYNGIAIGAGANVTAGRSTAIGPSASVTANRGISLGYLSSVGGTYSTMISSANSSKANNVSNSFAVNCNSTDHLFFVGNTADGYLNSTGNFVFGNTTVAGSAKLAVDSTTSGFLPPRMTTTEKNAIVAPASGLMVYDTTLSKLCVYTGAAWETITSV